MKDRVTPGWRARRGFALIRAEKTDVPVATLCHILKISRSGHYAWCGRPESAHAKRDRQLRVSVRASFDASRKRCVSPRSWEDLVEYDSAVMESFFSSVKIELGDRFDSCGEVKTELFDYIEVFYNQRRRHSTIGQVSPAVFEKAWATQAASTSCLRNRGKPKADGAWATACCPA